MANTIIAAQPNPAASLKTELRNMLAANRQAIADCNTYLAIPSPSNVQVAAQVRQLTQQMKAVARENVALIRLVANVLDSTT